MERYKFLNVRIFDKFIDKFAERYVSQRSYIKPEVLNNAQSTDCGFDINNLIKIIKSQSVFKDTFRENGKTPPVLNDIYRSDLGEILTTYYFEEKLPKGERYVIPIKNISERERYDMPGRGIDAIGYRKEEDGSYTLLLSEAKVSSQKKNPPDVVDIKSDSLYKTQKNYHDDPPVILQRLTDFLRHSSNLNNEILIPLACIVIDMENGETNKFKITYGCGLIRDNTCADKYRDFGKMRLNIEEFKPGNINFAIFCFTEKTIEETVSLFYQKVQEIING